MDHPRIALSEFPSEEGDSKKTANSSYAVVRYTVDFYPDTKKTVGIVSLSALLHELHGVIEADCSANERILWEYPEGFDILLSFTGRSELDERIYKWSSRFHEILSSFGTPHVFSLSAGVSGAMDLSESAKLADYANQAAFARNFGQLEGNPFVRYYVDANYQMLRRQRQIEEQICAAWPESQFQVYLQPQYELDRKKIVGAEALVRWNEPERGLIMPDEFIPVLEKNRCITKLDFWMFEECCKILWKWDRTGCRSVPLSVNFSQVDADQKDFVSHFISIAEKYEIPPCLLCLEWTESAFSKKDGQVIQIAEQLHEKGYQIAVDDFGTGYSSLNILADLPVDIIKWDKKLLDFRSNNQQRWLLLSQIMNLSKKLGFKVIAEGVETQWQAALLQQIGCKYVQGYLFAKPLPWEDCEEAINMG